MSATISAPAAPIYDDLDLDMCRVVMNWSSILRDEAWSGRRAPLLLGALGSELYRHVILEIDEHAIAEMVCRLLTAVLEGFGETEIDIAAAAFYAISERAAWRGAAMRLLPDGRPLSSPIERRLAALARSRHPDIPEWLSGP